jgi:hypothetical protein
LTPARVCDSRSSGLCTHGESRLASSVLWRVGVCSRGDCRSLDSWS